MKIFILTCLFAGLLVAEGRRKVTKGWLKRRANIKYCAWNNETDSYETVTKRMTDFIQSVRSAENKDLAPLHTGECGNCSQANICKYKFMAKLMLGKGRKMCGTDGKEYKNKCEFAIARCEAYNKNQTKLFPKPCQNKKRTSMCKKLEAKCNNDTSSMNETFCAWNEEKLDYETLTPSKPCFIYFMKCRQKGDKLPLHKGQCGNCSKENICKGMNPKRILEIMGMDDDEDDSDVDESNGNTNVKVGQRGLGIRRRRSKVGGKWRKNQVGKKGSKKMWRKVCDKNGNEYNDLCEFTIARCTRYAENAEELKRGRCRKSYN